ncbi:hypothetical protein [Ammoniphilus sp. YIM 78166]|nr:hypothetical protein [Ammoniphilus sp. YIM 78166]
MDNKVAVWHRDKGEVEAAEVEGYRDKREVGKGEPKVEVQVQELDNIELD